MSWSDRTSLRSIAVALGLSAALLVGGCQVRPLYGPVAIGSENLTMTLADVDVAPIEGRVSQKIRNDLLFLFNGGSPGNGAYLVELKVKEKYANIITRSISGLPGARNIRLQVTYTLKKQGEPEVLASGTVTRIAAFDYFNQRFANDRATIDAEDRAAHEIAEDIQLRVASYFATGKSYDKPAPVEAEDEEIPGFDDDIFDTEVETYGGPDT